MNTKITKDEAMSLFLLLKSISGIGSAKFMYFVAKNMSLLKPSAKALEDTRSKIEESLKDFTAAKNALIEKYGADSGKGKTIQPSDENWPKYKEDFENLLPEHKEAIDKYNSDMKEFSEEILAETEEIEFRTISIDECPNTGLEKAMLLLVDLGLIID